MSPDRFRRTIRFLWPIQTTTSAAFHLGVSDRTVRRWMAEYDGIPVGVEGELENMLRDLGTRLDALMLEYCDHVEP